MVRWMRGWMTFAGTAALVTGCASGPPPRELLDARAAYQQLSTSEEGRQRPADVSQARDALLQAEREYDRSKDSPRTRSLSYVALREAQVAQARGSTDLASRQQALAEADLRQLHEFQRQRSQEELSVARQQLASSEQARQDALRAQQEASLRAQAQQSEAQRLQAEAQQRQVEAERLRFQTQQQQQDAWRRQQEEQRRQQVEAEAQRLAQENSALQQRTAELEAQQQARVAAEQRAQRELEAERQARVEAERQAAEAVSKLDRLADVKVQEEARGTVLTLSGSILFASGAVDLLPVARDRLTTVADALKETQSALIIEGHTDSQGSDAVNEDLSFRRAERVRDFLVSQGVPAGRIEVRGLGEYRPVASNQTADGRSNNRRVEIILPRNVASSSNQDATGTGGSGERPEGTPAPRTPSKPPR